MLHGGGAQSYRYVGGGSNSVCACGVSAMV